MGMGAVRMGNIIPSEPQFCVCNWDSWIKEAGRKAGYLFFFSTNCQSLGFLGKSKSFSSTQASSLPH